MLFQFLYLHSEDSGDNTEPTSAGRGLFSGPAHPTPMLPEQNFSSEKKQDTQI